MSTKKAVHIARKIVWVFVYFAFFCIPVGGHGGAAPMFALHFSSWSFSNSPELACRACAAIAAYLLFRLVLNKDDVNRPKPSYGVVGFLLLSFAFLLIEISPLQDVMIVVFLVTLTAAALLSTIDVIVLRWLEARDRNVTEDHH